MEIDSRHYANFDFSNSALETWRIHACLPRCSQQLRAHIYATAAPFFAAAAESLVNVHAWLPVAPASALHIFSIQHPSDHNTVFTLPTSLDVLFENPSTSHRVLSPIFPVELDPADGRLVVPAHLADIFHLLQLIAPGCCALVKAECVGHELDDHGDLAWTYWATFTRALPHPGWMDQHASHLQPLFGQARWLALRRAAVNSEVLKGSDITFS